MQDGGLAAKYAQALEQVKVHREEVSRVLTAAKEIDTEAKELREENAQLRQRNTDLETHAAKLVADYAVLEAQVKAQQLRLQQYIDSETDEALRRSRGASGHSKLVEGHPAAPRPITAHPQDWGAPTNSAAPAASGPTTAEILKEKDAEIAELKKRIAALDESRLSAASAAETYRESASLLEKQLDSKTKEWTNARREFAKERQVYDDTIRDLRAKESALQTVISQLREHQARVVTESMQIEEVETKAKEGMRLEWAGAVAECERLTRVAELAQAAFEEAKANQDRLVEQMESQRRFINESNELAAKEMKALHIESTMLLEDLRTAVEERDSARKAAAKHMELLKKSTEVDAIQAVIRDTRAAVGHVTLDRGTQTASGFEDVPPPPPLLEDDGDSVTRSTSHAPAAAALDLEAMRELESAVMEWRSIAETTRSEITALRAAHRKELEDRAKEIIVLGNKAQEIAGKLKSAYGEIDVLTTRLRQVEAAEGARASVAVERDERPTPRSVSAEAKLGSELQRLAGGGDYEDTAQLERFAEVQECIALATKGVQETLVAAVQTHLIFTAPLGMLPTPDELSRASEALPEVPCTQFRDPDCNFVIGRLGGLRHLIKSLRTEVWAAAKRSANDPPGDTTVKFKALDGSVGLGLSSGRGATAALNASSRPFQVAPVSNPPVRSNSVPPPPPPAAESLGDSDEPTDDLEELLRGNSATLASLTGQLRWESARMDAFRAQVDRLRSIDDD